MAHHFDYDAIVIGAGSAGLTSSIGLSKVGKNVLLVERDKMGGECTNSGCIPSKSLIHLAREYDEAKKHAGETPRTKVLREKAFSKVRAKIKQIRDEESPEAIEKHYGIKVVRGEASFRDKHTVVVKKKMDHETYTAKNIIIATGSSARKVPIKGLAPELLLTNENLFELKKEPKKILIVGGGPIGCEMADALNKLGSKVTIVNNVDYILPREEPEISCMAEDMFSSRGIEIINNAQVNQVKGRTAFIQQEMSKGKKVSKKRHKVDFDYLLFGIGRTPNLENLNLEAADIKYSDRLIVVDKHYRTSQKNIYAIGDVSSKAKFTHVADDQGRHVVKRILMPFYRGASHKPIPRVTYLDQEVASVGVTYDQALKKYSEQEIMKVSIPYNSSDRAKTDEVDEGLAMVVAKRLSGKILGVSMIGQNAGELLSLFTLAMQYRISLYKINGMIVPYPILGQLYKKLSDTYIAQTFATLKQDVKYAIKKQIPKIVAVVFWFGLLFWFYRYKTMENLTSLDLAKQIYTFVTETSYGPLAYILIYAFRPVLFFPATLLTLISGALFGFWGGVFYTAIGENLSANLAYAIGRFLGEDFARTNGEGMGLLGSWQKELQDNSFISVLIMRFIYLPFDLVNYGCGILGVGWPAYALATFIGIIPGMVTFVSFGASIENIQAFSLTSLGFNPMQLVISIALFISSLIIARLVQRHQRKIKMAEAT